MRGEYRIVARKDGPFGSRYAIQRGETFIVPYSTIPSDGILPTETTWSWAETADGLPVTYTTEALARDAADRLRSLEEYKDPTCWEPLP